jgi:hypothetical protein
MSDAGWRMIHAFERGVDDGFFSKPQESPLGVSDEERSAYQRGYDHGVWMYCETLEGESK